MFDLLHTFNSLFWRVYLTIHHCFVKLYWRTTEPFDIHLLCEFVCNRFTQFNLVPSLTKIMKPNRHSIILIKKHFHFILCNTSFKDYWQKFWLCTFSFFVLEASLWIIDINLIYLFNIKSKGENFKLSNQHFIMLNSKKPFFFCRYWSRNFRPIYILQNQFCQNWFINFREDGKVVKHYWDRSTMDKQVAHRIFSHI